MRAFTAVLLTACLKGSAEEPPAWPKLDSLPAILLDNASSLHLAGQLGSPVIEELQWSFDGRHLGLRSSDGIKVYDFEPDKTAHLSKGRVLAKNRMPVNFCFSSQEDGVFTCDGGREITLWDIRSGWTKDGVRDAGAGVKAVAFSPTAPLLAAVTDDGSLRLWRNTLSEAPQVLKDHPKGAAGVSIDPKGKYAVTWAGFDDINVWKLESGEVTARIARTQPGSEILSPAFIDFDGVLWATAAGRTRRWKLPEADELPATSIHAILGPGCFQAGGSRCLAHVGKGIALVTMADGKTIGKAMESSGKTAVSFEPARGRMFALSTGGRLSLHDARSGAQVSSEVLGETTHAVGFSTDKWSCLYTTTGSDLRLLDLRKGGRGTTLSMTAEAHPEIAILNAKTKLVVCLERPPNEFVLHIGAWKLSGSRLVQLPLLDGMKAKLRSFNVNAAGKLTAVGSGLDQDVTVKLISLEDGKQKSSIRLPAGKTSSQVVLSLDFDPTGRLLAAITSGGGGPFLIDVEKGTLAATLPVPADSKPFFRGTRFSANGAFLATTTFSDGVLIHDVMARRLAAHVKVDGQLLDALDFSPDGRLLVCCVETSFGWQRTSEILVLDLDSHEAVARFPAHTGQIHGLEFLPSGKALVSFALDGCLRIWAAEPAKAEQGAPGKK